MAESFETFKLGGKSYTLDQLKGLSDAEMRKLIGIPRTQEQLAEQQSKEFAARRQPTISTPAKQPVGAISPRVRAREASGKSSTVPAPGRKSPAPSPVPAPRVQGPGVSELLKEPKDKSSLTPLQQAQVSALDAPTASPRDRSRISAMRKKAKEGIIYRADDEKARPGTRGYAIAELLIKQFETDPDLVPILDAVDPADLGWQSAILTLARRLRDRRGYSTEEALKKAHRVASAKVVVGDWPPGMVRMPETLDPKKMTWQEELQDALKPQVEIVGFNQRGQTITPRAEGRVGYFFRLADAGGGALSGLGVGLSKGKEGEELGREVLAGIREGKILYDVADAVSVNRDWAKDNPMVIAKLKQLGIAATLFTPDATLAGGPVYRGAKLATRFARAQPTVGRAESIVSDISEASQKIRTGNDADRAEAVRLLTNVEKAEAELRDKAGAFRDAVNIEESLIASRDLDAGDQFKIADKALAKQLDEYGLPVPRLVTMNPAFRRRETEAERVQFQDFREVFGLGKPYQELLLRRDKLRRSVAIGPEGIPEDDFRKIREELNVVEDALAAIDRNVEIRTEAYKNTLGALRRNVRGKAAEGSQSELFGVRQGTETQRAVDSIQADVASLNIPNTRVDADALQEEITSKGSALIPDAETIRALRKEADELNETIANATNMGASPQDLESLNRQLRNVTAELRRGPKRSITANELAEIQDQLELASKPRLGLAGPGLAERGDMPVGETPVESLERAVEGIAKFGAKDRQLTPGAALTLRAVTSVPKVVKSLAFGLDADKDLRKLAPEFVKRTKAGIRYIDQSASDFNALIREGNEANKLDYLTGARVKFENGQRVQTSGVDFVQLMQRRMDKKFHRLEPMQAERLRTTLERFSTEGRNWAIDLPAEERTAIAQDLQEFWAGDEFLKEVYHVTGRQPGDASTNVLNPPELELTEALLYYSKVTERADGAYTGGSRQAVEEILRKVDALYGRKTKGARDAVAQAIGVLGNVDEVFRGWTASRVAVPEKLQGAYADLLQGKAIEDPNLRAEALRLAEEAGFGASFKIMTDVAGTDTYIPLAARQRLMESLDRVLSRGRVGKDQPGTVYKGVQEAVQFTKAAITRGNIVSRPKYYHQNTMDRFSQLAFETGMAPALVTTARQGLIELTTIPGFENILSGVYKPGGEKARDVLQAGGDRLASGLNKLFAAGGTRIEVNKILDGTDDVIMVGDKTYTAKVLRSIFVQEGAASSFDNTELRQIIMTRRAAMGMGPVDPKLINDMAESISVRERYGAAVTLLERGMEPRDAMRLVNKAYYDYATSIAKEESSSKAIGLLLTSVEPFWAYKKNATRQIFNRLMSPEGAYRMSIIRRATQEGADIATKELYESKTDRYGVQVDALPEPIRSDYFTLKLAIDEHYDGKIPDGIEEGVRAIVSNSMTLYESGRFKELTAQGDIRKFRQAAGMQAISRGTPPRPDESSYRGYISRRPAVGFTPDMSDPAMRRYFANQSGSKSHLALVLPEDTLHGAMEHMAHVSLLMAGMGMALQDDDIDADEVMSWVGDYWDLERAPVLGVAVKGMASGGDRGPRISKTLANMLREEGLYTDGETAKWGTGPAAGEAHYLPGGMVGRGFYTAYIRSLDDVLKRMEGTPMLNQMGRKGDILKLISAARGYTFTEGQRERSAEQELRRKRIEMRANIE